MVHVLIIDDHPIVREGIKQLLESAPAEQGLKVCGEAGHWQEVLALLRQQRVDLVLLDILMPGKNGLEILKMIRHEKPRLPVIMLSMMDEDQYALRALKAGASGYLTKDLAPGLLLSAIDLVLKGSIYVSQAVADRLAGALSRPAEQPPHELLSDREYEVLRLIGAGQSIAQIAEKTCLSAKTISTYRNRILAKMALHNNAELINYAIKQQLVF